MANPRSPAINDFATDPKKFLNDKIVSSEAIPPPQTTPVAWVVPDTGYAKLVQKDTFYEVKYHGSVEAENTKFAYFLGYNHGAQQTRKPAFLDIPKSVAEGTFLFTGTLGGCSVVVTALNAKTYRVFHDPRQDSSVLYDNVVMAMDWSEYNKYNEIMCSLCMQYRDGRWQMLVQLQARDKQFITFRKMKGYDKPVLIREPGSYHHDVEVDIFKKRRDESRAKLRRLAAAEFPAGNIPDEPDGAFEPFEGPEIKTTNLAVRSSQAIREFVEVSRREAAVQLEAAGGEYPLLDGVMRLQRQSLYKLTEPTLKESKDFDFTYLWLLQKEAKGINEVVITDGRKEAPLGSTAGEKFTDQELDRLLTNNKEFAEGYGSYENVEIQGFASDMTSLEMKTLYTMSANLSEKEQGALVRHISIVSEKEYRVSAWHKADKIVGMFQDAGAATKPMPQNILLGAVPDEYGGRCYPLVRAMAVALSRSSFHVDQLGIKLIALKTDQDFENARLLRTCLRYLHSSRPAVKASRLIGVTNLKDAVDKLTLGGGEKSKVFALNTEIHSMLLGVTEEGRASYHFYDPNFTLATFPSKEELLKGATKFFKDLGYADTYGASGTLDDPIFTLLEIDTDAMAAIQFEYRLDVGDLSQVETLVESIDLKRASDLHLPAPDRFTEDRALSAGAELLQAAELADAWQQATAKLEERAGLGRSWMPVLDSQENEIGGGYRVKFVNLKNPSKTLWISTADPEIKEFTEFIDERLGALRNCYRFQGGTFVEREGISSAEAIDGLSTMFMVKTLIEHFTGRKETGGQPNSNLAIALKIHSYLNLTQLGQAALGDIGKIIELTQAIIRSEGAAQSSLSTIIRAFGRVSEGAGIVLGGANVVFDIYELSNAENEVQKAVFGTQLAFDSASFLASAGSVGAGMVGASSAAAVLGGAGVILAGLGIGIGALAASFGKIAADAGNVGRYFGDSEDAYKKGGYKYDAEHKILIPLPGAVIKTINLNGHVDFDSQYIYRTHHGKTGSGRINYFFWAGDFPRQVTDKSQAINVRVGIGAPATGTLAGVDSFTTIILPASPKSYISYEYQTLPFATGRHDYGFDVIRRLEQDERFDFDFYIFPSEYIIQSIKEEYVDTPITVKLGERSVRLQVPSLSDMIRKRLSYTLQGTGAEYTIGMEVGPPLTLSTAGAASNSTRWILDCRQLNQDAVTVDEDGNGVTAGGVHVAVADKNFTLMLIITAAEEVRQVDFDKRTTFPLKESAEKFPGGSEKLLAYLNDLNEKHLLQGRFIVINDYSVSSENVGRAYYDVAGKRVLYTKDAPKDLTKNAQLGSITGDEVYFYDTSSLGVWRVSAATGTCLAKYNPLYPSPKRTLMRIWQEDNRILAVYRHELGEKKFGELTYVLGVNHMTLFSVIGDNDLLNKLKTMDKLEGDVAKLLTAYEGSNPSPLPLTDDLPGAAIDADIKVQILSIFGEDDNEDPHRYWLRLSDGAVIKPNFKPAADIVLAGSITTDAGAGGLEEFYFYSRSNQAITLQTGTGTSTGTPVLIQVPAEFAKLSNVFNVNNEIFAVTDSGYILRVTQGGTMFLEAVNTQWFRGVQTPPWWEELGGIGRRRGVTTVTILGVQDVETATVPMWHHQGRVVIASHGFHGKQVHIVGLSQGEGETEAWLGHLESSDEGKLIQGQLYSQPLLPAAGLSTIISPDGNSITSEHIPAATPVLKGFPFETVVMTDNGLQYTTTDGIILLLQNKSCITLYGVTKAWQTAHRDTLEQSLVDLAKAWDHGEVIILQDASTSTPAWYIVSSAKIIAVKDEGVTWNDGPLWLGTAMDGTTGYFYLRTRGQLYSATTETTTLVSALTIARRFGDTLILGIPPECNFTQPTLRGVKYAMITQQQGSMTYVVPQESWDEYDALVLQDRNVSKRLDKVQLDIENPGALLARSIGEDLVIMDVGTGQSLTIRKAFGKDPKYGKIGICTSLGIDLSPADIQEVQSWFQGIAKLENLPDIALKTVAVQVDKRRALQR